MSPRLLALVLLVSCGGSEAATRVVTPPPVERAEDPDAREERLLAEAPADSGCDPRHALAILGDAASPEWLPAQRCAAGVAPRRTSRLTVEQARSWAAAGEPERVLDCLEACTLGPERAELEALEKGDGYERRIRRRLDRARDGLARMVSVEEGAPVATALLEARSDLRAHAGRLGARAATLDRQCGDLEKKLGARLPGIAEIELINLSMRSVTTIEVIEKLIPDPIDVAAATAELTGSRQILDHMRAVVAGAGATLVSANDWSAQIDALEQRFRNASAKVDARIQRRVATIALVAELCKLDQAHDEAVKAQDPDRKRIEDEQKDKQKQLRGLKGRYDRRRDCR